MSQIGKLTPRLWSHYRILLTVKDEEKRKQYEQLVIEKGLGKRELQEFVKKDTYRDMDEKKKEEKLMGKEGIPRQML